MTTDFSKGSPTKLILTFTVPYLIGNLFQQFYNIADTVIVGQILGVKALAAVGACGSLVWFASGAIQSLTTGFSAVTAQKFGAGDMAGVKKSFALSVILSAVISVCMTLLCCLFAMPMLRLLKTPEDIIDMSFRYLICIFAGLCATALYNLLSNMIRALGDSRTPLYFLVVASVVNIILDIVFVLYFEMGPGGAGVATVVSQLISGVCCIFYIVRRMPILHFERSDLSFDGALIKLLLKTGLPMALLNMVISVGGVITTFVYNRLSTLAVAAYTAANKLEQFVIQPFLSLGSAVAVFCAQNYGAKEYRRIRMGVNSALVISFIWVVIASCLVFLIGKPALTLVVSADGVTAEEYNTILSNGFFYIIANTLLSVILAPLVIYKSALQSLSWVTLPLVSGFTEIIGRAGTALLLSPLFGFVGVCFANPAAWFMGLVPIVIDYFLLVRKLKKQEG